MPPNDHQQLSLADHCNANPALVLEEKLDTVYCQSSVSEPKSVGLQQAVRNCSIPEFRDRVV